MKNELLHHRRAYGILILGLLVLTITFLAVWPDRTSQRIVIAALGLFYFLWGIMAHLHTLQLTKRVIYEYASMSILATILLLLITF